MKKYTFEDIREKGLLLYEFVRGSVSQGINTQSSDIDHGGIYLAPAEQLLGLGLDYQDEIKSEKGDDDWMELNNNLKFSKRYMKIFRHPLEGMWVAYEALSFVFEFMKDGKAANVQIFSYNGKSFWIGIVNETVIFITPEENEGKRRVEWTKY